MGRCRVIVGIVAVLLGLIAGGGIAELTDEQVTLELSLMPVRDTYVVGEPVEFVVRVDNPTDEEMCVPRALGCGQGYLLYTTTDPSGDRVVYECEIVEEFQGGALDVVCLSPGSFYGVLDSHTGLQSEGEWTFVATYYGPSSREYSKLCDEKISSLEVAVLVSE